MISTSPHPLMLLQQEVQSHGLTMAPVPIPKAERVQDLDRVEFKSVPTITASAEFFWQIVGDPKVIIAFLTGASPALVAYFGLRGSKSIRLKSGNTEVDIKGHDDEVRALNVFRALQGKNDER